jgi:hypothetical protein
MVLTKFSFQTTRKFERFRLSFVEREREREEVDCSMILGCFVVDHDHPLGLSFPWINFLIDYLSKEYARYRVCDEKGFGNGVYSSSVSTLFFTRS